ncbi:MAG TPA: LuxR C-terminal-related transcriptional regulator [Terriglobales bacterium]|nr:LuxR C-terminal-related transcriptional regulator [Terriglobales bacterium]
MAPTSFPEGKKIRVFLADSSPIHTRLLTEALRNDSRLEVIGSTTCANALVAEAARHAPNVAVISSNLDDEPTRGFEIVRELRASNPQIRVVMLLHSHSRETILEAFRAGARGIFSRTESVENLCKCVHCVHEGQVWATGEHMAYALEALASAPTFRATDAKGLNLLSKRELQVVQSLAEGLTNREIAERMKLSQHTVKNYLFRVFEKLGVSNRVELLFMTMSQTGSRTSDPENSASRAMPDLDACQRGAEEGFPSAQMVLAEMYRAGKGVPKDPVAAYMWYLICEQSSQDLMDDLKNQRENLSRSLSAEQLAEARKRASQYMKRTAGSHALFPADGLTQVVAGLMCAAMVSLF